MAGELIGLTSVKGVPPRKNDSYDPTDPWFGNSILKEQFPDMRCTNGGNGDISKSEEIDWIYGAHSDFDLRMMLVKCVDNKIE